MLPKNTLVLQLQLQHHYIRRHDRVNLRLKILIGIKVTLTQLLTTIELFENLNAAMTFVKKNIPNIYSAFEQLSLHPSILLTLF